MRFVVVGAGAVGAVLGISLEHGKHDVLYLVRKGRKARFRNLILVDAKTGAARRRDSTLVAELGDALPPFEWALVCVRGEQVDEAIAALAAHVRPDAKVGVAAAAEDAVARVRAAHPGGPVVRVSPTFSAWTEEDNVYRWFALPLVPTLVSSEGDPQAADAATELANALVAVGVPARAATSPHAAEQTRAVNGPLCALLAGWELAAWDAAALVRDGALRDLTARAMHEAAEVARAEAQGPLRHLRLPSGALSLLLRALPRLTRGEAGAMWRHHGPKVALQTRATLAATCARAGRLGVEAVSLRVLADRLPEPRREAPAVKLPVVRAS